MHRRFRAGGASLAQCLSSDCSFPVRRGRVLSAAWAWVAAWSIVVRPIDRGCDVGFTLGQIVTACVVRSFRTTAALAAQALVCCACERSGGEHMLVSRGARSTYYRGGVRRQLPGWAIWRVLLACVACARLTSRSTRAFPGRPAARPSWRRLACFVSHLVENEMSQHPIALLIEKADKAINEEDFDTVVDLYAEDAVLVIRPGKTAVGKVQIRNAMEAIAAHFDRSLDVRQAGMVILETGDTALVLARTLVSAKNSPTIERKATYAFRKDAEDRWMCAIDNSYGHEVLDAGA